MSHQFARSNNGKIHLISAINGEYTVCGNAFDGEPGQEHDPQNPYAWEQTANGPVTCKECAREIKNCQGVKVKE